MINDINFLLLTTLTSSQVFQYILLPNQREPPRARFGDRCNMESDNVEDVLFRPRNEWSERRADRLAEADVRTRRQDSDAQRP